MAATISSALSPNIKKGIAGDRQRTLALFPRRAASAGEIAMVKHVHIVAILMIALGGIQCLGAIFLFLVALVMPSMFDWFNEVIVEQQKIQRAGAPRLPAFPAQLGSLMTLIYVSMGVLSLASGALNIFAGARNLRYRGRILGIVAMIVGAVTGQSCLLGIALLVYGLIVYLDKDVVSAFERTQEGTPAEAIPHGAYRRLP
jgi:hypothetical protein